MHELEEWELIQIVIVYCTYEIITSAIAWLFFIFQGLTIPIGQLVVSHKTEYSKTPPLKGVSPKAEFHPTKLNSDKGSTQLRQGRFNSDKTRFSPDRQNTELLWATARFLLSLLFLAALYEGEKDGGGRRIFWNNSLNMLIRVMAPYVWCHVRAEVGMLIRDVRHH